MKKSAVVFLVRVRATLVAVVCALTLLPCALAHAQGAPGAANAAPRLTKAPVLTEFVEAPYPEAELAEPRAATVILSLAISEQGEVVEAEVVESAGPHFDAAALDAARRFRFDPAEMDGVPAPVRLTYRYAFAEPVPELTTGGFRGVVLEGGTGAPLSGIQVEIEGVGQQITGDDGSFGWDELEAGTIRVTFSREDLTPLVTEEVIEAGAVLETRYDIELPDEEEEESDDPDDLEIVVRAPPELVRQVVSTQVRAEEARRVPGTQGDVLKVVENLPGIARAAAGSGEVVVWGAAPQDTRTYVGAVRVPMLYHFGGLRSVLHNDAVAAVELVPGAYGAAYGRGLGGLVLVERREPERDRLHGSAQLDVLDASVALTGPVVEKLSFSASARRSHIGDLGGLLADQSFQQFFTLPNYYDGQVRLRYDPSPGASLEVGGMVSGDAQTRTQPSNDPALRSSDRRTLDFQRVDLLYRLQSAEGSVLTIAPWYGRDAAVRESNFGGVPARSETDSHLVGLRAEWRGHLADTLRVTTGFDFELVHSTSTRSGSITFPPREGDPFIFGRSPADQLNFDTWKTMMVSAAVYGELDYAPFGEVLHVVPGVRLEPYLIEAERRRPNAPGTPDVTAFREDVSVEPRLSVRYAPIPALNLRVAGGLYRQPPLPDDLSAVFGNPLVSISRGQHLLAGAGYQVLETLSFDVAAFHTRSQDLISRNPASNPRIAEVLVQDGEGRSTGAQLLVRKDKGETPFFGWVAYTIMKSERRTPTSSPWRPFDFDQTHVLTFVGSYDLGAGVEVGLRFRLATGFPRTPVVGAYWDSRENRYEPLLGEQNSARIPTFLQLDARIAKRFRIHDSELELYLDVQNTTNRDNFEEIAYAPDYAQQRYIRGLPILPVLGARWEF